MRRFQGGVLGRNPFSIIIENGIVDLSDLRACASERCMWSDEEVEERVGPILALNDLAMEELFTSFTVQIATLVDNTSLLVYKQFLWCMVDILEEKILVHVMISWMDAASHESLNGDRAALHRFQLAIPTFGIPSVIDMLSASFRDTYQGV